MTSLAVVLKSEITRVARKEARAQNSQLKKASSQHRTDVAALKRRVLELEKLVKSLAKRGPKSVAPADVGADDGPAVHRYSAKGFAAQRKRLGLSAAELGVLLGVSNQSVYKWEEAKTRPRASHMPAIAALRRMSEVIGPLPQIAPKKHCGPSLWQSGGVVPLKTDKAMVRNARV